MGEPGVLRPVEAAYATLLDTLPARFTLELDLPPKILSPNVKPAHWASKVYATRSYRKSCWAIARKAKPRNWTPRRVAIDVEYRCSRGATGYVARDTQNAIAALKSGVDGALVDAGIVPDDSAKWLSWGEFTLITREHWKGNGVTLTVREV